MLTRFLCNKLWGLKKVFQGHQLMHKSVNNVALVYLRKKRAFLCTYSQAGNWLCLSCVAGLEIFDPEEVEYIRSHTNATVGGSVTLDCGSIMPTIFIWGFTKPGSDNNIALAYNYGQGPKVQSQSSNLGRMHVPVNTSALVIEELQSEAAGTYTCQALYDTEEGARITFYFTGLDVEDGWFCFVYKSANFIVYVFTYICSKEAVHANPPQ